MIRTVLIGFGLSAKVFHLPFLQTLPAFELIALSTRQTFEAQKLGPGIQIFAQPEELLAQTEADLAIIATPNASHFALAEKALQNGMHVVLEKPFVNTLAEGKALIRLAEEKGRSLSVYHNRRWDGDFLTLQNLLQQKRLGEIHFFHSHFDRFRPHVQDRWRENPGPGTGSWFDLGSHLLDQALLLFGWPEAVNARILPTRKNAKVADYFHVQLHYPGLEVLLTGSAFVAGPKLRFELQGELGTYRKFGMDPQEERLKQGIQPLGDTWAAEAETAHGTLWFENSHETLPTWTGGYQNYYQALAQALENQGELPVTAQEALNVIYLLELAEQSAQLNKTLEVAPAC
ncbi:oxidoreductase [bacterium (Candidatus Blackallbacteria) CG17_big_fil_post_rev_8_21_14_2_50_48_46]|uniref:Oxidoreductase n=1 Tax=bacterium (Candidatus Blackallbacteria) CG17_big_fil_post_rev_8_21_14_2_50_48_46 TaxID=2014261 RepID=A0A2M7G8A3_9BACT|nr:MAG: oxidoreductase [bacterium (Candidatus Blackallbacteria) CG18_big_fil_WC_8_21_14_2_50_49_26]PIW18310.1 MAG: oxidoreductase [bacterium (Candidatus Blackallbacteria) CG17_big_fil_post_rev_8_21_14_2_50_48_46]PIW49534.1 MAG: oxidoreductase [bacterium (Candidatus Blackallbacteria) CG13_big_fil_rev_8_21_14_2_50_49_14]